MSDKNHIFIRWMTDTDKIRDIFDTTIHIDDTKSTTTYEFVIYILSLTARIYLTSSLIIFIHKHLLIY